MGEPKKHKHGCCIDREYESARGCTESTCMELPAGETCGGCVWLARCTALGFTSSPERTSCDFFPRRFRARASEDAA